MARIDGTAGPRRSGCAQEVIRRMGRSYRTEKSARIRKDLRDRAAVEDRGYVTSAEVADVAALYEVGTDYVQQLGRLLQIGIDRPYRAPGGRRDTVQHAR